MNTDYVLKIFYLFVTYSLLLMMYLWSHLIPIRQCFNCFLTKTSLDGLKALIKKN